MDDGLKELLADEHWSRNIIREDPYMEMMYSIIRNEKREMTKSQLFSFISHHYMLRKSKVQSIWNSITNDPTLDPQVREVNGIVKLVKKR